MVREKFFITLGVINLAILIVVLNVSSPMSVGPVGILGVFIMMYLALASFLTLAIFNSYKKIRIIRQNLFSKKPTQALSLHKSYYYASVVALLPVMLIGVQSVGSLGLYETGLIILFVSLAFLYVSKRF